VLLFKVTNSKKSNTYKRRYINDSQSFVTLLPFFLNRSRKEKGYIYTPKKAYKDTIYKNSD
jgi:hypothetical protein